jgi:dihydrolipoamide dehydrogenase
MLDKLHIVVIGGGPGGYAAAIRAAQAGASVTLVEKDKLGGTCLHSGCVPTKALLHAASVYRLAESSARFGVAIGDISVDLMKMQHYRAQVSEKLYQGLQLLMEKYNINVIKGVAALEDSKTVLVQENSGSSRWLLADRIILATGAKPLNPPIPGSNLENVLDSDNFFALDKLPNSIAIIGGGAVGIEFGSFFTALGVKVTVLEMLPRILPGMDQEIARRLTVALRRKGMDIRTGAQVTSIAEDEGGLLLHYDIKGIDQQIQVDQVLMAVGRAPNTEGLGLKDAGIKFEGRFVAVNDFLETNVPGIYAIGDLTGGVLLAHKATAEGIAAARNCFGERCRRPQKKEIPSCVFSTPEAAGVGLTEEEAKASNIRYSVAKFPLGANGRAQAISEAEGVVKVIGDESGKLVGVHFLAPHASELVAEATLALKLDASIETIAEVVYAHPTVAESFKEASELFTGYPLHTTAN